ncbi:MAG: hypothetical protein KatS3mg060_0039 [Dehalococcoidia bacterium]|nr:MAG: hypothetical protein KatS3mg060_0039 [Dehalococcoidia bacterium]
MSGRLDYSSPSQPIGYNCTPPALALANVLPATQRGDSTALDRRAKLRRTIDRAWSGFLQSYAGLSDDALETPGVVGTRSAKDLIAHVTIWEEEALRHLPTILVGQRPPRNAASGRIDAFRDRRVTEWRTLSLEAVRRWQADGRQRLLDCLDDLPDDALATGLRAWRQLRLDAHGHSPLHARAVAAWRPAGGLAGPAARS